MQFPPKIKILDFKRYDGTKDPRHHLCHYQSKMIQYWDYEEFIIQTFQDNLTGSALDWFMTLRAADIPTWTDLSQKFLDQYRFCAETPPTLLDLSMMEMKEDQTFEAYVAEWRGKAAKHIPTITERQQLIEAGKKLDMGIKLGRIEGPTRKKEGETSKTTAGASFTGGKKGKETSVNSGRQSSQSYFVNFTPTPPPRQHIPAQAQPNRTPASRPPQLAQRAPAPQTQQGSRIQSKSRPQYPPLLEMIYKNKLSFNEIRPANVQANPLPDHGSSSGQIVNMIVAYFLGEESTREEESASP
ncbi:hypothetical protein CRG98_021178 [Punica granatum]|uniref:Retrotransposon gag domain-containing protein n=1 Tax=Punica granatum TaxID=22663 RepID=A0A2I0JR87_PUNGR|nr:hypothetical protein CRG98_021178 [Punica granatum]